MLTPLIVGFGRSGRDLHLHCLRKLKSAGSLPIDLSVVHAVDAQIGGAARCSEDAVLVHRNLESAAAAVPLSAVVHVCTPPQAHAAVLARAASLGFRRFLIEKPMASSNREAEQIARVTEAENLDVLVVANWLTSALTDHLRENIATDLSYEPLGSIVMRQTKSRVSRANGAHASAFDIEMPHLVALALHLAGVKAELAAASSADIVIGNRVHRDLGSAYMEISHASGLRCQLYTDLACPMRERSIEFRTATGMIRGFFPVDGSDSCSYLYRIDEQGVVRERRLIADDPLTNFLDRSYRYFHTGEDRPRSDVAFNQKVVALLSAAKAKCNAARARHSRAPSSTLVSKTRFETFAEV
jgi:predicted dehydrogenase